MKNGHLSKSWLDDDYSREVQRSGTLVPDARVDGCRKCRLTILLIAGVLLLALLRPYLVPSYGLEHQHQDQEPFGHQDASTEEISAPERSRLAVEYALINENFPDPCFIESNGTFYAFATRNSTAVNIQVATAPTDDIQNWTLQGGQDALPDPGPWTAKQLNDIAVWAPSVVEVVLEILPLLAHEADR